MFFRRLILPLAILSRLSCLEFQESPYDNSTPRGYFLYNLFDKSDGSASSSASCGQSCRIFVTQTLSSNLGGVAGADALCNSDPRKVQDGRSYKAWVAQAGVRVASMTANAGDGQIDWIFRANATYLRNDGVQIGTTGANALLTFPLAVTASGHSGPCPCPTSVTAIYTGMFSDWRTDTGIGNCGNWTSTAGSYNAGDPNITGIGVIGGNGRSCSPGGVDGLLCVEQ